MICRWESPAPYGFGGDAKQGAGLALAGLVLGWVAVILGIIVVILGLAIAAAGMHGTMPMH